MRVYVVDNGGQWTHREWRVLKYLGAETKIVPNTATLAEIGPIDGLVLSGGAPRVGLDANAMGRNGEYLDGSGVPILGICAGHQFMALHCGGDAKPSKVPEFGKSRITVAEEDDLFRGLPREIEVWESHNDEVAALPKDFMALASSRHCAVQAMKSRTRPLYGVQFHPEVEHTAHGPEMFKNFLAVCEAWR